MGLFPKRPFKNLAIRSCLLALVAVAVACGRPGGVKGTNPNIEGTLSKLEVEPKDVMVPTRREKELPKYYDIYELTEVKIAADAKKRIIGVRIDVNSNAGRESVDMAGSIRADGSATLTDLNPLANGKHRLTAEAYCADQERCERIILNVFYKVGSRTLKKQFVTAAIAKKDNADDNEQPSEEPVHVDDDADHGEQDESDPENELLVGEEQRGEFVGAARNEEMIKKLWDRPETPQAEPTAVLDKVAPEENKSDEPTLEEMANENLSGGSRIRGGARRKKSVEAPAPAPTENVVEEEYIADEETTSEPEILAEEASPALTGGGPKTRGGKRRKPTPSQNAQPKSPTLPKSGRLVKTPSAKTSPTVEELKAKKDPALKSKEGKAAISDLAKQLREQKTKEENHVVPDLKTVPVPTSRPEMPKSEPELKTSPVSEKQKSELAKQLREQREKQEKEQRAKFPVIKKGSRIGSPDDEIVQVEVPTVEASDEDEFPLPKDGPVPMPAPRDELKAKEEKPAAEKPQAEAPKKEEPKKEVAKQEEKRAEEIPAAPDKTKQTSILEKLEAKLSPYLDLKSGGYAVGDYDNGRLKNGTDLPDVGSGFRTIYPQRDSHWGTGMMISLLKNLSALFIKTYWPSGNIMVGDISLKSGGKFGSHSSHRIGLDADIAYVGNSKFETILSGSRIVSGFDYAKTWQFLRLIASQQIVQDGQKVSVLNRVFMNPKIKEAYCSWAETRGLEKNAMDAEILRRIRPTAGHTKHFHVRLRCSPHYPECRNQVEPIKGTGC